MEHYQQLDALLFYYHNAAFRDDPRKSTLPDYGLNISGEEQTRLEDELAKLDYLDVRHAPDKKRIVKLTGEGIDFFRSGGFAKEHIIVKAQTEAKNKKEQIEKEERGARLATIKQGEYAEKAYSTSVVALIISVGALFKDELIKVFKFLFSLLLS